MTEAEARALRKLATADPAQFRDRMESGQHRALLREAMETADLRVRWNLIQVLGKLPLSRAERAKAIDWLLQRLDDTSPFTRTFALQALADLLHSHRDDKALQKLVQQTAERFLASGTAAMRARARKLLKTRGRAAGR